MTNIVRLPDSMQRAWRVFEAALRETMIWAGYSVDEIEYSLEQLKPLYLRFAKPEQFSGDPEKVVLEFNDWVQAQITGLLLAVAEREIDLFRLRGKRTCV